MKFLITVILGIFFSAFFSGCTKNPSQKKGEQPESLEKLEELQIDISEQVSYQILDEIPIHVKEVVNTSVFSINTTAKYDARLIPVQTYGKTGEYYLTKIEGLTVDDNGRVIISNLGSNYELSLQIFNADGSYFAPLSRPGRGPGEYIIPFFPQAKAEKVYLYDVTGRRINVYNGKDYSFEQQTLIDNWNIRKQNEMQGLQLGGFKVRSDGNILGEFYDNNLRSSASREISKYLLIDLDGNSLDFIPFTFLGHLRIITDNNVSFPNIFPIGRTITAISSDGELFAANTQEFFIKKYDAKGVYQSAFYYPIKGSLLNLDEFLKSGRRFGPTIPKVSEIEKVFENIEEELPKTYPVVDNLIIDDENRIWVAVPIGVRSNIYEWWVLSETGELLAKLMVPREQTIYDIKGGFLYSKNTDKETGDEYVVKYRVELSEN